jgi:hypothetical protein
MSILKGQLTGLLISKRQLSEGNNIRRINCQPAEGERLVQDCSQKIKDCLDSITKKYCIYQPPLIVINKK